MKAFYWKISTFASVGAAAFFALRSPFGGASGRGVDTPERTHAQPIAGASPSSWLGGLFALAPTPAQAMPRESPLAKLKAAKTVRAQCEAVSELAEGADDEALQGIIDLSSKPGRAKTCAIEALGKAKLGAARSWLTELLHDRDPQARFAAIEALAAREDDAEARAILFDVAHDGAPPEMKTRALVALGNRHVAGAGPLLLDAIEGANPETQAELLSALGESHDRSALPSLAKVVKAGGYKARQAAIHALGALGGEEATSALADILRTGGSAEAGAAIQALADNDDPSARKALLEAATDPQPAVAEAALRALGDRDGDDVRDVMVHALESNDPKLAGGAAGYFAAHQDERAIPQLLEVARRGTDASAEAVSALAAVGGESAHAALVDVASRPGGAQALALHQLGSDAAGKDDARKIALQMVSQGGQCATNAIDALSRDGSSEARDARVHAAQEG